MAISWTLLLFSICVCRHQVEAGRFYKDFQFYPPPAIDLTDIKLPEEQWFNQNLDHFDGGNQRTWQQRYFVNGSFYKQGGPVFISIGGEGKANPVWMVTGAWVDYAKKFNAFCILLEHRYYGKSWPRKNMTTENLKYLSSEQALADLANFIAFFQKKFTHLKSAKWIAFGGSYPGSLAAWSRLKYPHLIYGAVASSAPLEAQLNFKDYLAVVRDSLNEVSPTCVSNIAVATRAVELLLLHRVGWRALEKSMKLCDPLDGGNKLDVQNLFASLAGNFEGVVQYNRDNRAFEGVKGTEITIEKLCKIMDGEGEFRSQTPLERYASVNELILKTYELKCLDYKYANLVESLKNATFSADGSANGRQWTYQTCTEFGFFQTSDLPKQPFGKYFPLSFSLHQCIDAFGDKFDVATIRRGITRTNENYGAKNIKVTRVLFPNGSVDPWHRLGLTSGNDSRAIYIQGTAHCANMYPPSAEDPPSLVEARQKIQAELGEWLADGTG